jgi:hypothetical protein
MCEVSILKNSADKYLVASDALAICLTLRDGVCTIHTGRSVGAHGDVVSTQWIDARQAVPVARAARRLAGDNLDVPTATAALARSAASLRETLTPDDVARSRAENGAHRIEQHLEAMRAGGGLRQFNREYTVRRTEARASGHGFMSYSAATARLRSAMIERLVGRDNTVGPVQSMFAQIFGD